ncbi:hypothetical protein MG290_05355 [Flavobacterium sp. CBA20B-1]|uniref:hypothetical protein n=1 Tax=unclassified Flavobacterium TaxID=196869 RepID=UPI0022247A65|nr:MULTISPECIES: hypothetical protein [unclassified Flavobacterium]WCM43099.1 hypothetical protein MG290_05355 [Flavobacterium sp. CBA20B-1]
MKKIVCSIIGLMGFFASAQESYAKVEETEKKLPNNYAVTYELTGSSTGLIKVSGSSSLNDLKEIEQLAENHGIKISFVNEKFNQNRLEYIELMYLSNGKWETLTFGTDDLKLLPFGISFFQDKRQGKESKRFSIKNNKNNRAAFSENIDYEII